MWTPIEIALPESDEDVLGYNEKWITDQNPSGIRVCFLMQSTSFSDKQFIVCKWHKKIDDWRSDFNQPTHWRMMPDNPEQITMSN